MKRNATAVWQGTGKEGKGNLTTQSKVINLTPYSYIDRFGEGGGTNPEELIAAAHAACFTLKLSFVLGSAGFTPGNLETKCEIELENGAIITSHLILKATVAGITNEKFQECVADAKSNCPVSKLLKTDISVDASLV